MTNQNQAKNDFDSFEEALEATTTIIGGRLTARQLLHEAAADILKMARHYGDFS